MTSIASNEAAYERAADRGVIRYAPQRGRAAQEAVRPRVFAMRGHEEIPGFGLLGEATVKPASTIRINNPAIAARIAALDKAIQAKMVKDGYRVHK